MARSTTQPMELENIPSYNPTEDSEKQANASERVTTAIGGIINPQLPTIKGSEGQEVYQMTVQFEVPTATATAKKIYDVELMESINRIKNARQLAKIAQYVQCKELAKVADNSSFDKLGFNDIGDFAYHVFGIKKKTALQYANIGRIFITDEYHVGGALPDMPIGHLLQLLSIANNSGLKEIEDMFINGTLYDGMTQQAIKAAVREYNKATIEDKSNDSNDNDSNDSNDNDSNDSNDSNDNDNDSNGTTATTTFNVETTPFDSNIFIGKALADIMELSDILTALNNNGFTVEESTYLPFMEVLSTILKAMVK